MNILLAGYNIDYDLIRELQEKSGLKQDITPETISAAYARISRSPKSVDELRADAVAYVDMEAGHAAQNLSLQAVALGLGSVMIGAFDEAALAQLLQLPTEHRPRYYAAIGRPK